MAIQTYNLGPVTAYGDAVAGGYTGTQAEWQALMANYAVVGQQATQSATEASNSANRALEAQARAEQAAESLVIDTTLTQSGKAADAKAVGDRFSALNEQLTEDVLMYKRRDTSITDSSQLAQNKIHNINTSWYTDLLAEFGGPRMGILVNLGLETQKHYQILLFDNGTMYQRYITANNASVGNWMPVQDQKCQVINTINEMSTVTADKVLVLHNNSPWGTGGPCWFEYLSYATEGGYARKDGGKMYPMLDQGPLIASTPPVERMMSIISSYVENENLIYGNDHTLFETTTTNEIDCSAFVSAVLHGIAYSFSKYVGDANRRTEKISSYSPTLLTDTPRPPLRRLRTRYMAQYFAEQGWLHKMPSTYNMRDILQFGDILFSWDGKENSTNRFLKIAHVSIVLAVRDSYSIIVAQCGGYPDVVTALNNVKDPTRVPQVPGKISTINLTTENINTYFSAFARIPYTAQNDTAFVGGKLKPVFIPNTYIDEGRMGVESISGICATSYGYIKVNPSSVITFTGATSYRGYELIPMVAEYDEHMQYLAKGRFTSAGKTLTANTRYIKLCYAHSSSGDRPPMLLEDIEQFEATIS